jgi:hypothetical protein
MLLDWYFSRTSVHVVGGKSGIIWHVKGSFEIRVTFQWLWLSKNKDAFQTKMNFKTGSLIQSEITYV